MSGKQLQVSETLRAASERLAAVIGVNPLEPVFKKAEVVIAVREWLQVPEVMEKIKQLKNTPSGFQTDEKAGSPPYDDKTLAIAVTDALAAGFQLVGNEFNIISGRMMGVLNGYHRLVREWKNDEWRMGSLEVNEGDIKVNGNMISIPMTVDYTLISADGQTRNKQAFVRTIQLRARGASDTPDAWIGKATRRIFKKLHVYLTGLDIGDDMGDEGSVGGAPAPTASTMPPEGKVDLAKEKPKQEEAEEASWSPVDAGAPEPPPPNPEPAPPAAEKPYAEMNQAERREATAKAGKSKANPGPPPDIF